MSYIYIFVIHEQRVKDWLPCSPFSLKNDYILAQFSLRAILTLRVDLIASFSMKVILVAGSSFKVSLLPP